MKVFDSVYHPCILLKLEALGITGDVLSWLKVNSRRQKAVINGQFSSWLPFTSVVPQGSVLGPLLFLLYINDISTVISHSKVKLFADDVTIYKETSSRDDVKLLQLDLSNIVQWAKKWLLRLNPLKCNSIVISNKHSQFYLHIIPSFHTTLLFVTSVYWLIQSSIGMNTVNTFQPKLQDRLTFFVTFYIMLLHQLNLLLTDA